MFPRLLPLPPSDLATVRGVRAILAATTRFANGAGTPRARRTTTDETAHTQRYGSAPAALQPIVGVL